MVVRHVTRGTIVAVLALSTAVATGAQTLRPQGGSIRPAPQTDSPLTRSPTGPPPWRPTGPAPWNPTGREPLGTTRSRPSTLPEPVVPREPSVVVGTVGERGGTLPVVGSFYCETHGRGFAGRGSFAEHVEGLHGRTLDDVSGALVDGGGVFVLPAR